jgi:hypothetical protein
MEYILIVNAAIQLVRDLVARGKQTGELTAEQITALEAKANAIFEKYGSPAPSPEGV